MVSFILFAPAFLDYMELENQKVKCLTQKEQGEHAYAIRESFKRTDGRTNESAKEKKNMQVMFCSTRL